MAVLRDTDLENPMNYVGAVVFFCGICCIILLFKFKGFKARINFSAHEDNIPTPGTGIYRTNREEFFGYGSLPEPPKRVTPSKVNPPTSNEATSSLRPSKSTSDLIESKNYLAQLNKSMSEVSLDPRGPNYNMESRNPIPSSSKTVEKHEKDVKKQDAKKKEKDAKKQEKDAKKQEKDAKKQEKDAKKQEKDAKKHEKELKKQGKETKKQEKEKKKIEKQQLAEQKTQEVAQAKLEQEQKKQEKFKKAKSEQVAQNTKAHKKVKRTPTITDSPKPNIEVRRPTMPPITNTVESDIPQTSGPPPYSEVPQPIVLRNDRDNTGNTSFSKPISNTTSSWDMISQHRQQIARPSVSTRPSTINRKQVVMDLNYKIENNDDDLDNSEA
ncbi:transcription initiation factor TFIID subunit 3-like [Galleria mellonella]|uniref:Transcription initiation factor TFIID subunit 3-like n=1 Tax=Galleria mellonella TaxID=7137 RepID=A0A6J1X9J0_GALME|nr:transcription initiation factor TFIID subunit 3-like [Galleria mellonella]